MVISLNVDVSVSSSASSPFPTAFTLLTFDPEATLSALFPSGRCEKGLEPGSLEWYIKLGWGGCVQGRWTYQGMDTSYRFFSWTQTKE